MAGSEDRDSLGAFQQHFGFSSKLKSLTASETARVIRTNSRSRLVAGVFGSLLAFVGFELLSTPADGLYWQYWRVYRCNWAMLWRSRRIAAVRKYVEEEAKVKARNSYYHAHLVQRLAELCAGEVARRSPVIPCGGAIELLCSICQMYPSSSGSHIHSSAVSLLLSFTQLLARGAECPWPALWHSFTFLLTHARSHRTALLYALQDCMEAARSDRTVPPQSLVQCLQQCLLDAAGAVETQAVMDALTLLVLKHPGAVGSVPLGDLAAKLAADPQGRFVAERWKASTA